MSELGEIRRFWENAARQDVDRDGLRPTARDPHLQDILETFFERLVWPGADLLDVGCGDGASTVRLAAKAASAVGVDYIEGFVKKAAARGIANCTFLQGDATDLGAVARSHGRFDIAVSIRCLINLGSWAMQAKALGEMAACLKPGGLLLISEGWDDGMAGLNLRRSRSGLPPIAVAAYNLLLDRAGFEAEARKFFEIEDYLSLGPYLFVSRVLQPLLVAPAAPKHDHPLNAIGALIEKSGAATREFLDCDYAGAYVLRRKA